MKGYPDNTFKPKQYIKKSEFTAALVRSQNLNLDNKSRFEDAKGRWFEGYVGAIENLGATGKVDGTYGADDYITRAEATKLVNMVYGKDAKDIDFDNYKCIFTDISKGSWYYKDVIIATRK